MRLIVWLRRLDYSRRYRRRHPQAPRWPEPFYMLHIGKTGGTFTKRILKNPAAFAAEPVLFVPFGHNIRHDHLPAGARFMFCTRDPVSRFVSGFSSRQRKGQPTTYREWSRGEAEAFARFDSPNALAEALGAPDAATRDAARAAMAAIKHVGQPHAVWFPDRARLAADIAAGRAVRLRQEHLAADLTGLLARLGCRLTDGLLEGLGRPHANPNPAAAALSPAGRANIAAHYAEDLAFLRWLDAQGLAGGPPAAADGPAAAVAAAPAGDGPAPPPAAAGPAPGPGRD